MHILILIGSAIAGALVWYLRFRGPEGIGDLFNAGNDVRLAAKRWGYRRGRNKSPIESIDDARLAAAGILIFVAKEEGSLTQAQEQAIEKQFRTFFQSSAKDSAEMIAFGRWIVEQDDSLRTGEKLLKRIFALSGTAALPDLKAMILAIAQAGRMGENQVAEDLLVEIQRLEAAAR